jgi:hypothetical protein
MRPVVLLCPVGLAERWSVPLVRSGYEVFQFADLDKTQPVIDRIFAHNPLSPDYLTGLLGGIVADDQSFVWVEIHKKPRRGLAVPDGNYLTLIGLVPFKKRRFTRAEKILLNKVSDCMLEHGMVTTSLRTVRKSNKSRS